MKVLNVINPRTHKPNRRGRGGLSTFIIPSRPKGTNTVSV